MNINLNITPNTVLHPVKTNVSKMTERVTLTGSIKTTAADKPVGRFDTFTLVGSDGSEKVRKLSAEKAELVRNLDNLSEEEKAEVAVASYIDMQKCCKSVLDRYETDMYSFKSLQEKKAYYNELKNQGGIISEEGGKYAFAESNAGSVIGEKEIDAALSEVQERINRFIMAPSEETAGYELTDKIFRSASQAFSKVTGITDDALNLGDDSLCKFREGLTEENYLEKTNEAINSIKNRSQQIRSVMSDYTGRNSYAKDLMTNPNKLLNNAENKEKTHLAELLEQYREQIELTDTSESDLLSDLFSEINREN